jgi:2,3-bisphosphoglycerate-dependent phosphoglycerate mutase
MNNDNATLVLVRHGLSEYNEKGLWAGWTDTPLTEIGRQEAEAAGYEIKDIHFDFAYTSVLSRAIDTLEIIKKAIHQDFLPTTKEQALNERNYGDYAGKNKWEVKKELGEKEFQKLRRSWDFPIPNGESLKEVYERVIPYYRLEIEPKLMEGSSILLVSSGNALRALIKYLENIKDDKISELEIATGEVHVYKIDSGGKMVNKEIRNSKPNTV